MRDETFDYLIVGAGIIGLTLAYELKKKFPNKKILVLEKEDRVARHASGRNSGVLHSGFYYTADSLKAKFTVDGNREMKEFCTQNQIKINHAQKVVVAQDEREEKQIEELYRRGKINGVDVKIIDEEELKKIDPNAKTHKKALFSPNTASVDPIEVCEKLVEKLNEMGVTILFNTQYKRKALEGIETNRGILKSSFLINTAGLYADKIAKDYGHAKNLTIIPFKGIYLKYKNSDRPIKTNIYPVPNLKNPFLGVHYTLTSKNIIKIGPTSIPAFWRENYKGLRNFKLSEFLEVVYYEAKLFLKNSFGFRDLAFSEIRKYWKPYFVGLAESLVHKIDGQGFKEWLEPGIRAQLLNKDTLELVQDFVIQKDDKSLHVLNAVSPAFTCSFPFARYIIEQLPKR